MNQTVRKLLSLLLCVALLCMTGAGAYAENTENAVPAETGSAEVNTVQNPASDQARKEDSGIIDSDALKRWTESFAQEKGFDPKYQALSIGFCYTGTGDFWFYNPDIWMYSASMYKVPVSMLLSEKVASGELTQESVVNGTTVEYVESTALIYSNNDSGHSIVSYLGGTYAGKCSDMTEKYTDLPADYFSSDFLDVSYYTARYMTQVMKTLYDGGDEKFPHVIEYLLQAQPGAYFRKSEKIEGVYQVAQKFGAYEEPNGNNNNHCAAIIYTPTPIVVVVMTRNIMDYQNIIAQIGAYLADYSLELDAKAEEWARTQAEQAAEEARIAADNLSAEMPLGQENAEMSQPDGIGANGAVPGNAAGNEAKQSTAEGSGTVVQSGKKTGNVILAVLAVLAVIVAVAIVVLIVLFLIAKKRAADYDPDEEEPWEDETLEDEPERNHGTNRNTKAVRNTMPEGKAGPGGKTSRKQEHPESRGDSAAVRERKQDSDGGYKPRH